MNTIIIAPHPDDEIIGCFEVLERKKDEDEIIIIYISKLDNERKNETSNLKSIYNVQQYFLYSSLGIFLDKDQKKENIYYFPDPIYEIHPEHRKMGAAGENLFRNGYNVIFYSTIMNAPYIHEVKDFILKEEVLNRVYPSQKSLWEHEHKFFIFEGRVKWLM
jgi:hypothetical protein